MKTTAFGNSGVQTTVMGLGCMGMSEFYGDQDDVQSMATLERAFELGVTLFDTGDVYGRGHNERLVGEFARGKRDKLTITTKFGIVRDPDGPLHSAYDRDIDNSPAYMRQCCDESLGRLGIGTLDLYYVHRADPNVPIEETVGALAELKKEGKIRGIGLSEVDVDTLRRAHAEHPIDALQSEYSLWTREPELNVLPACKELGISFVAYSPLGRGFLTGTLAKASELDDDDFRLTSPRFQGENFDANLALVEEVRALGEEKGCKPGQIAIAWLYFRGQDIIPIPGTKRIKYLEENVGSLEVDLSQDDLDRLEKILPIGGAAGDRYEAGFAGFKGDDEEAEA
jgi:aryl-alcohol dehydrogenase-like predicted oxidoreductase